jgi:uncharacterized membrane protein
MQNYLIWGYVHIMLLVFWLGADVGVFTAALMARNAKRSFEARMALIRLATIVDFFPRVCFSVMLPVGLHLTKALSLYPISTQLLLIGWGLSLYWIVSMVVIARKQGTKLALYLGRLTMVSHAIMGLIFVVIGINSLVTGAPLEETWFALKLLLFGLVFWAAIAIDVCFHPFLAPFMEIGQSGSTPEREEAVSRAINNTLVAVFTLYVILAAIAFVGKVKPL